MSGVSKQLRKRLKILLLLCSILWAAVTGLGLFLMRSKGMHASSFVILTQVLPLLYGVLVGSFVWVANQWDVEADSARVAR